MQTIKTKELKEGESYQVLTYAPNTWNDTQYLHRTKETGTTRELFYFKGQRGIYPVLKTELKTRVKKS